MHVLLNFEFYVKKLRISNIRLESNTESDNNYQGCLETMFISFLNLTDGRDC